ncbi:class I SAM-dependent methyltransferase [Streptomyces sp. CRN 30]|uniref:class I SAM-dependent methyltransferase n=1 Tax=Streptomyces sp. CRN 30 TaxID=3075613 RepID=UPI002A7ECA88|nr:class I SAM-dependent methyltransferase [Streptomyces sp. CRN 30]
MTAPTGAGRTGRIVRARRAKESPRPPTRPGPPDPATGSASARRPKDPSLRRSVALFRAFLREQRDPEHCYTLLARDAADQVEAYDGPVRGRTVVDVGGGCGYFTAEFRRRGAHAYLFEPDVRELGPEPAEGAVVADGYLLPLADGAADVCFSSNVLEHVADPGTFLSELVRVTRPGGLIYVSFTNWLSPWGGHEWAPWHYLGAERARARYRRRTGGPAKHTLGENLFAVHIGPTLRLVRGRGDVRVVAARSRYWPFLARAVVKVPVLREFATWNLLLILRRCPA